MKLYRKLSGFGCYQFLVFIFFANSFTYSFAQIRNGTILFERRLNTNSQMLEMLNLGGIKEQAYTDYISNNPKFKTSLFNLFFNSDTTVYLPHKNSKLEATSNDEWFAMCAYNNKIQSILSQNISITEKEIFSAKYQIIDSLTSINWKVTNEVRNIAGYECRRANAVIMDSIYVVAFYSPAIQVSGGPESIHGLPGMILGLALPYEHITWFAKEVSLVPHLGLGNKQISENSSTINSDTFQSEINGFVKSWGPVGALIKRRAFL